MQAILLRHAQYRGKTVSYTSNRSDTVRCVDKRGKKPGSQRISEETEMLLESILNPSPQFNLTIVGKLQAENI